MIYSFSSDLYQDENQTVQDLLEMLDWNPHDAEAIHQNAIDLVEKTRAQKGRGGQLEAFLQEFSLNTEEGLAMMCLAEALLRIPDTKTANALIKDKVAAANWLQKQGSKPKDWMSKAAGFGMALTQKTLDSSLSRLGEPIIREAMIKAMQMMGKQFVLGTSIHDALSNAKSWEKQGYRMSYDMLGEGARDAQTAENYFLAYMASLESIGENNQSTNLLENAGISVKLSALHPRYTYSQKDKCIPAITKKLKTLAIRAAHYNMPLTVDAEECNRLDISITIIENVLETPELKDWHGFGLAIQAYQKRSIPLIHYLVNRLRETGQKMQVRLVKGAYWDNEIKQAQIHGLPEYPVFTRKVNTDISYLACAQTLLKNSDIIYPMFATHNAHTIAAIQFLGTKQNATYEFQRLHGMGDGLYAHIIQNYNAKIRVYAPVGAHKDLLPYLVRRLLENGANSSFVNQLLDKNLPAKDIVQDPVIITRDTDQHRNTAIPLPKDIFGTARQNSQGIDLDDPASSQHIVDYIAQYKSERPARSIINGEHCESITSQTLNDGMKLAKAAFKEWNKTDVQERALKIEAFADLLEKNKAELLAILVHEAGKTIPDARDEFREAIDFCRYYAAQARTNFNAKGVLLSGYTGEMNTLTLQGRGVFICISPWNFPLAIFTGQIIAALAAGNAVLAKPASQTRYIATRTVELMLQAGIPSNVLHLFLGDGRFGGEMVSHKDISGVVFTGSTATAKHIQKTIAESNSAIIPFIAETGGQNAMIADSSALPEQIVDDVIRSAFGSAGQRCSALRVLYIQDDIAENVIGLLKGSMKQLVIGDSSRLSADIGQVIDSAAKKVLDDHIAYLTDHGTLIARAETLNDIADNSPLFPPAAFEISDIGILKEEVFGPILHVIRFKANELESIVEQINATGYGLTFGLHSRINARQTEIADKISCGNLYINRSMTGAVVGVQPFGGMGLSGTGPKAGGPHYLYAFATEKVVTNNTTASGGNTTLISTTESP